MGDRALSGKVAIVTGATRGAGLAVARELGAAGATVFVTGRSTRGGTRTEGLAGTIEDAAYAVTVRGGVGVPVRCDHANEAEVRALFERVVREAGRPDLLVNNAWGGYEHYDQEAFTQPFWQQPFDARWRGMFESGLRAMLLASSLAAPHMIDAGHGLIASTVAWAEGKFLGNVFYDTAKAAIVRATKGMGQELAGKGVAAVAIAPGFMRTERVMAAHAAHPFDLSVTESPVYLARAVVSLASDPQVTSWSGQLVTVGDLAKVYGFTDEDGGQPPPFRIP